MCLGVIFINKIKHFLELCIFNNENKDNRGYVYFLRRKDGLIKIGCTSKLIMRIKQLSKINGKMDILKTIECSDKFLYEKVYHFIFNKYSIGKEFFNLNGIDFDLIADDVYILIANKDIKGLSSYIIENELEADVNKMFKIT